MRYAAVLLLLTTPTLAAQPPAPPLRGPLRNRAADVMTQIVTDMTLKMVEDIPRAVAESVRRGDYQLELRFSATPPAPNAPVRNLLRRLAAPRP